MKLPEAASSVETPIPSPVTVIPTCCQARGLRAPSRSQHARTMRSEATLILQNAYSSLVRDSQWCATDIHEAEARRTPAFRDVVVRSPEQDAIGVLASANAMMRYVFEDDYLLEHNLDIEVRYWLAAILFSVYKVKTEERWLEGHSMTMRVLEQFLLTHELGEWRADEQVRKKHEHLMWVAEATLLCDYPFATLVDGGVYGAFETACVQLMEVGAFTSRHGTLAAGIVHFYLHGAHTNAKIDVLETLALDFSTEAIGAALAYIVLVTVRLKEGRVDTALDLSAVSGVWHYDTRALTDAAFELVRNADLVAKRGQRLSGAYTHPAAFVYKYVCASTLQMLMNTLAGSVIA